jgi:hypothetical protein
MLAGIHKVAERNLGEVERILRSYFNSRDDLEPVTRAELKRRMQQGLVTVLDVRPEDEFKLGHLPGARNVPLSQLNVGWRGSTARQRSSLTAEAPIASWPSRRLLCYASAASRCTGWVAIPSGGQLVYPSKHDQPETLAWGGSWNPRADGSPSVSWRSASRRERFPTPPPSHRRGRHGAP